MDNVQHFRHGSTEYTADLVLLFRELPLPKLRKIYAAILSSPENEKAVQAATEILEDTVRQAYQLLSLRTTEYKEEYVDPEHLSGPERKRTEYRNKKLLGAVNSAKTAHERAEKRLNEFNELRKKLFM